MIRVVCADGAVFTAPTAAGVVRAMKAATWMLAHEPKRTYVTDVIGRVADITGETIRRPAALFLADLARLQFLTIDQDTAH